MGSSSGSHEGSLISAGSFQRKEKWPWNWGSTHLCLVILNRLWGLKYWGPSGAISSTAEASVLSHPSAKTISEYYLQIWRSCSSLVTRAHTSNMFMYILLFSLMAIFVFVYAIGWCLPIVKRSCRKRMAYRRHISYDQAYMTLGPCFVEEVERGAFVFLLLWFGMHFLINP